MKITLTPYVHARPADNGEMAYSLFPFDMSGSSAGYACLGQVEVSFDKPDVDPAAAMIASLEQQIAFERAESQRKVNHLLDRISRLQCLEYKPEDAA